ncbi:MAG: PsiF family protein [Steroidobacteraceae bacterium]|jgi:psiF repeat-containing protein
MRVLIPAITVCLLLLAGGSVTSTSTAQSQLAAPAAPALPPAAATGTPDNDAAARHAKRTACLKQARAKKLVGAQRTAYIKDCTAAP